MRPLLNCTNCGGTRGHTPECSTRLNAKIKRLWETGEWTQVEIAKELGITTAAINQRVKRMGLSRLRPVHAPCVHCKTVNHHWTHCALRRLIFVLQGKRLSYSQIAIRLGVSRYVVEYTLSRRFQQTIRERAA